MCARLGHTHSRFVGHTGRPSFGMAGGVLLATALHVTVGGALWLGGALSETRPALPVSDIIMIEVVSEPAGETMKLPEPTESPTMVEPERVAVHYEVQPQRAFTMPPLPVAETEEEPDLPVFDAPSFEIPAKKPAPKPAAAEPKTVELTPKAAISAPILSQQQSVPIPRQLQTIRQSNGQGDGDSEQSGRPPAGTTLTTYAHNPKPTYPREARRLRQEGVVVLLVDVSSKGRVLSVVLTESSGHPLLDKAAQQTIRAWRFVPATRGGAPVRSMVEIPVRFYLSDS